MDINRKKFRKGEYRARLITDVAYQAIKKCYDYEGSTIVIQHKCIKEQIINELGSELRHLSFRYPELSGALSIFSMKKDMPYIISETIEYFGDGKSYLTSDLDNALKIIEHILSSDSNQLEIVLYKIEDNRRTELLRIRNRSPNRYGCNSCYFFNGNENFCRLYNVSNPKKNPNLGYNCNCFIRVSDKLYNSNSDLERIITTYSQRCQGLIQNILK